MSVTMSSVLSACMLTVGPGDGHGEPVPQVPPGEILPAPLHH